jgi:hypothetical protein
VKKLKIEDQEQEKMEVIPEVEPSLENGNGQVEEHPQTTI